MAHNGFTGDVQKQLGLPQEKLPDVGKSDSGTGEGVDTTRTVMNIVASHNDSGGITFNAIFQALKDQGITITREYLHTILNRKKNRQKKLQKRGDKWFLTEKGEAEVKMKTE